MLVKCILISLASLASFTLGASVKRSTFSNILVVILENTNYANAIADPNLQNFAASGVLYSNWIATTHPSQPNYIAFTSGSTNGVTSNAVVTLQVQNVVDLLDAKGLTWKAYMENWPGNCFLGSISSDSLYYRKHNPFISYADIQTNATRCAKIVSSAQLTTDINSGQIPNFAWYTPNIRNDGHDTGVTFAGQWLASFLASTGAVTAFDVVMVTFDETASSGPPNHVYTAIAGKAVLSHGITDATALTHYSLLSTMELNFGLGNLGKNDVTAPRFTF